jgi:hypothetical protein
MTDLTTSIKQFTSLNLVPGAVWTEATKRKAPHKPILLLAVLDLVHRSVITSPFIDVTGDLVELNKLFNLFWRRIIPLGQSSSPCCLIPDHLSYRCLYYHPAYSRYHISWLVLCFVLVGIIGRG